MVAPITRNQLENASQDADSLAVFVNGNATTDVTTRLGAVYPTVTKLLSTIGYEPPINYTSGISLTRATQTVFYNNTVYAPKPSVLPYTTGSSFDSTKFLTVQGVVSASQLADETSPDLNANLVHFLFAFITQYDQNTLGWVSAMSSARYNVLRYIPVAEWSAIFNYTSTYNCQSAINQSQNEGNTFFPEGLFNGLIKLKNGVKTKGCGVKTVLRALPQGGTLSQLVNYQVPSVVGRDFTPGQANPYVAFGSLEDMTILGNVQTFSSSNYIQILLDERSVSRFLFQNLFISNSTDSQTGQPYINTLNQTDKGQNYGIVTGTRPGGVDYCGGEENIHINVQVWDVFKNISVDDAQLAPNSSAHGTVFIACGVQGGHELFTQNSTTGSGLVVKDLTIQNSRRQSGNSNPTIGISLSGYDSKEIYIKYGEMGAACDKLAEFSSTAKRSKINLAGYSSVSPSTATVIDNNPAGGNTFIYNAPVIKTSVTPNETNGAGRLIELVYGAYKQGHAAFTINTTTGVATVMTSTDAGGNTEPDNYGEISLTRVSVGRWQVALARNMPNNRWRCRPTATDASGNAWTCNEIVGSQSRSVFQFVTWKILNGGTVSNVDPENIFVDFSQAI